MERIQIQQRLLLESTLNFKKNITMKKQFNIKIYALSLFSIIAFSACTDLEIEETDSLLTPSDAFAGVESSSESLVALYGQTWGMLGDQANFFALNSVTTDEHVIPTRGSDWGDNGLWRSLHNHTWKKDHGFLLTTWNQLNEKVLRATEIIHPLSNATAQEVAEAKFLRAFNMFFVLDMWGQNPFREATDAIDVTPAVLSASEAYAFILNDLNEAIASLPEMGPSAATKGASKAAANFLKAKLILNSERYTGTAPNYAEVISAVDAIEASGFALQAGYFDLFLPSVDTETVLYGEIGIGNRIWNGMHYNIVSPDNGGGGWNGFSTLAEYYDLFEGDPNSNYVGDGQEERRGWVPDATNANNTDNFGIGYGFLIGQQYAADGTALQDRAGNPLVFTREFSLTNSSETQAIRMIKYHPFDGSGSASFRSHEIMFRFADAHLMRAEAMLRNGDSGGALTEVNELRTLRGATALGAVSLDDMIDERGRELYMEFFRRNDLLRFGQYTKNWEHKDASAVGNTDKNLFPIPVVALISNPGLVQNPGY